MAKLSFLNHESIQRFGIQSFFRVSSYLAPSKAASLGVDLFLKPRRYHRPKWEDELLSRAERIDVPGGLAVWRMGDGPRRVLLVHGWNGRGTQLGRFVPKLLEQGFQVILFDFPAHGESAGRYTHLREWVRVINELFVTFGNFDAVIAHSLGGTASLLANVLEENVKPGCFIVIGAPNYIADIFRGFYRLVGMRGPARRSFEQSLYEKTNLNPRRDFPSSLARNLSAPLLVVHDENDLDVRIEHGEQLERDIVGARLLRTRGLGHRRILKSDDVIEDVIDFLLEVFKNQEQAKPEPKEVVK